MKHGRPVQVWVDDIGELSPTERHRWLIKGAEVGTPLTFDREYSRIAKILRGSAPITLSGYYRPEMTALLDQFIFPDYVEFVWGGLIGELVRRIGQVLGWRKLQNFKRLEFRGRVVRQEMREVIDPITSARSVQWNMTFEVRRED